MTAIALAVAAGGAIKSGKTTVLMTGAAGVAGMKKADTVAKTYKQACQIGNGLDRHTVF